MKIGAKYMVVKGGMIDPFADKSGVKVKVGEVWDLVDSLSGPQLRRLNKNGSSVRLLNGRHFVACGLDIGKLEEIAQHDPAWIAHSELIAKHSVQKAA